MINLYKPTCHLDARENSFLISGPDLLWALLLHVLPVIMGKKTTTKKHVNWFNDLHSVVAVGLLLKRFRIFSLSPLEGADRLFVVEH